MAGSKQFRPLKRIEPPEHVLIDLHGLYPAPPHSKAESVSGGVKVNTVVDGTLTMLGMTEEGVHDRVRELRAGVWSRQGSREPVGADGGGEASEPRRVGLVGSAPTSL